MDAKRKADTESALVAVPKRAKQDIVQYASGGGAIVQGGPPRTSSLQAPIMLLSGHQGDVYASKFNAKGNVIASASFDQRIFLWNVFGECENFSAMSGHTGAVLDLAWTPDSSTIVSVSTDKFAISWDAEVGAKVRRFRGHSKIVNSVCTARTSDPLFVTGSDDGTIKLWDARKRSPAQTLQNEFAVTAVSFNGDASQIISGGIDNLIKVWEVRKSCIAYNMAGHTDSITALRLSPDGNNILSNAMDSTVRSWNVRPFAAGDRLERVFVGAQHNFEKNLLKVAWTPDARHIGAGSSDRNVYVWNYTTGQLVYRLPGHKGSVNEVDFHPDEPIVLSGSSDKTLYLGELAL